MMAIHMRSQHRRANYHAESQLIPADFARTSDFSFMNTHFDVVPGWFFNSLLRLKLAP